MKANSRSFRVEEAYVPDSDFDCYSDQDDEEIADNLGMRPWELGVYRAYK